MKTKFKSGFCVATMGLGLFIDLLSTLNVGDTTKFFFILIGRSLILIGLIAMCFIWRCPHCRKGLPIFRYISTQYCHRCGDPID